MGARYNRTVIVAQISDLHIKARGTVLAHMPHVSGPLRRALATINRLVPRPDAILATGDLVELGMLDEYQKLRFLLAEAQIPVYLMPGNHDRRRVMRAVFADHEYLGGGGPIQFVIEGVLSRVVALDSSEFGHRGGYLDPERLAWLETVLRQAPNTPTLLALHHPPFRTGVAPFDAQQFYGREQLAQIVRENPQICRIACGHVHQVFRKPWNGALGISAPSTAPTLVLHPNGRGIFLEPGGFMLHYFNAEAGISSERMRTAPERIAAGF